MYRDIVHNTPALQAEMARRAQVDLSRRHRAASVVIGSYLIRLGERIAHRGPAQRSLAGA